MKNSTLRLFLIIAHLAANMAVSGADLLLRTRLTNQPPGSVQLEWNSQPGTSYQLLFTTNIEPFSFWVPGPTVVAPGTAATANVPATNALSFQKLHTLGQAGSGLPTVAIISHTNGQTVSGLTRIKVSAQDDSRVSFVSLTIDGLEYLDSVAEGDIHWDVNTGHYSNGVHTVQARVVDNSGNAALGGNPNSSSGGNETVSAVITLNFTNILEWREATTSFTTFVPISIQSLVFPTNWTVYVENESGAVIRTFTGYTTDGVVETEWDGKDNNGVDAPVQQAYRVLFFLGALAAPPAAASMSGSGQSENFTGEASRLAESAPQLVGYDQYGSPVYEVFSMLPLVPDVYFDQDYWNKVKEGKRPPLPPLFKGTFSEDAQHPKLRTRRMSLLEAAGRTGQQASTSAQNSLAAPNAAPAAGPDVATNDVIVWRETPWVAGKALLTRQVFLGGLTVQVLNTKFANNLEVLENTILQAAEDDPELGTRGVCCGGRYALSTSGDFDVLLQDLKSLNENVTEFYYIGHSVGSAIGYSEGSPTNGITWQKLRLALGNFAVTNSLSWGGRRSLSFRKPYRFVFIDGCLSARGPLRQSFGIIEDNWRTQLGKKRRAYMGWNASPKNSLLNQTQADWSGIFWQQWVNVNAGNFDVPLTTAINSATALKSIPENPFITGYQQLTWAMDID